MNILIKTLLTLCGLLLMGACASAPAAIGEDANYMIEVTNPSSHAMTVSANLGAAQMAVLGELAAGQTRRFEIRDPATNDIELIAATSDNSHRVTKHVELKRGVISRVTLD